MKRYEFHTFHRDFDSIGVPAVELRALCDEWLSHLGNEGWSVAQLNSFQGETCMTVIVVMQRKVKHR